MMLGLRVLWNEVLVFPPVGFPVENPGKSATPGPAVILLSQSSANLFIKKNRARQLWVR